MYKRQASDGAGTFSEVNLEPKRLTAYIDVSKQFLIQDSNSAEEMLKREMCIRDSHCIAGLLSIASYSIELYS